VLGPVHSSVGEPTTFHQINCRLYCSGTSAYTKGDSVLAQKLHSQEVSLSFKTTVKLGSQNVVSWIRFT